MGIFSLLFFIILFILLFGLLFILAIIQRFVGGIQDLLRILRGEEPKRKQQSRTRTNSYGNDNYADNTGQNKSSSSANTSPNGKIFASDEGTYVDFEEQP